MYSNNFFFDLSISDSIATISLNGTAFSTELLQELLSLFSRIKIDPDISGLLLTGFSATSEPETKTMLARAAYSALGQSVMSALENLGKPVVAVAIGTNLGAGLELALAADFIVSSNSASFGFPGILSGEIPCFGGTQRLTRAVGKAMAKEMIFTGNIINSEFAMNIGLINRIYEDHNLFESAHELLVSICKQGTLAIRMAKEIIDAGHGLDIKTACLMERDAFALCFATLDQREGMGSFLERRPAAFQGK